MGKSRDSHSLPASWRGIRLRRILAAADPDGAEVPVTLPASWDNHAAAALAALAAPERRADIVVSASAWIDPVASADAGLGIGLHSLLRLQRGAPSPGIWRRKPEPEPGFTLNLAAFFTPETGFDREAFGVAVDLAVEALSSAAPTARRLMIGMADLSLLLSQMGLDYDSGEARRIAADLAGFLTARASAASAGRHEQVTGILPAGPVEALLGVETTGMAAPIAPLDGQMNLARWARAKILAKSETAEQALAAVLSGADPFGMPSPAGIRAMHEAVAPHFHVRPERGSVPMAAEPRQTHTTPPREPLPSRRAGYTQKASVGGHRLFVRTGDYEDGRLGEISVTLPKESPALRGLMDAFAAAVSIGLQHGVPLDDFIEAFAGSRFGPGGAVEGDAAVPFAGSLLDYVFRHLAANYPNDVTLDPPEAEMEHKETDPLPFLPMELPRTKPAVQPAAHRRPFLKLVG